MVRRLMSRYQMPSADSINVLPCSSTFRWARDRGMIISEFDSVSVRTMHSPTMAQGVLCVCSSLCALSSSTTARTVVCRSIVTIHVCTAALHSSSTELQGIVTQHSNLTAIPHSARPQCLSIVHSSALWSACSPCLRSTTPAGKHRLTSC